MNNEPRQKLRELIVEYGRSLCDDPNRCEALLKDHCGTYKREIFVLVSALRKKVADDLLKSSAGVPQEIVMARLRKRLEDEVAMADAAAQWAVESWALALGFITASSPMVQTAVKPEPRPAVPKAAPAPTARAQNANEFLIADRYLDNHDGTVTDVTTGLQWMRFSLGQDWKDGDCVGSVSLYKSVEALKAVDLLNSGRGYAGHRDWLVPAKDELLSIVERFRGDQKVWSDSGKRLLEDNMPKICQLAFPATPLRRYWSSSTYAAGTNSAWLVDFNNGLPFGSGRRTDGAVRLTRRRS